MKINLNGVDKAEVLKRLYDYAIPVGYGILQYVPGNMSLEQAKELISGKLKSPDNVCDHLSPGEFDYLYGRYMKIDLSGDVFHTDAYDAHYGKDMVYRLINDLLPK